MLKTTLLSLVFVLIYLLAAQLGIWLRPANLHITLLWPPSGIALAAVLLLGRAALPAIFFAGLATSVLVLTNLVTYNSPVANVTDAATFSPVLVTAFAVSVGSTIAVWLAAKALRYLAPNAPLWNTSSEVVLGTIAIGVACLIYSLGTISALYLRGALPAHMTLAILSIWFIGNFMGMIIFAPLAYVIARHWLKASAIGDAHYTPGPTLFYSLFSAFAFFVFIGLWNAETRQISGSLEQQSERISGQFEQLLQDAKHDLQGIRSFFYASERISEIEFGRYVKVEVEDQDESTVTQAVGWAPRITDSIAWNDTVPHHSSLYELDASGKHVPVAPRAEYFPVQFIQPLNESTRDAIGFDLYSNKERRDALQSARDTGKLAIAAPITLVQSLIPEPAMLIALAVYRADQAYVSIDDRRANLRGFATGVYLLAPLFEKAVADNTQYIDFHFFDVTHSDQPDWYHSVPSPNRDASHLPVPGKAPSLAQLTKRLFGASHIQFAERNWLVVASPGPSYILGNRSYIPWGALLLLLLVGVVLTCILIERIAVRNTVLAERRKTEQALAEAQAANNSKSFLMAAASHDIKQPLLALGMLTDTLLMGKLSEPLLPLVKDIKNSINQMSTHFDTLMDVNKFRDGSFTVTPSTFRLGTFAARLDLEIAPLCEQKGLQWRLEMDDALVSTDQELLLRLFRNLLINAVQYTQSGEVSCTAKAIADRVQFLISDTGSGIAEERQTALFSVFDRLQKEGIGVAGSGLGLAIVSKISVALGLNLQMSSQLGQGTLFRFQLPRAGYSSG